MNTNGQQTTPPDDVDDYISPRHAAKILRAHVSTVYRVILDGRLPAIKRAGSRYLVRESDVRALMAPVRPVKLPPTGTESDRGHQDAVAELRRRGFKV